MVENPQEVIAAKRWLLLAGAVLMIAGAMLASAVQTNGGIRVLDVRFAGTGAVEMSGLLFVPPNATTASPAPGVLAIHGYFNSRETQGNFAVEFARRGYVVLALDQTGHGYSDAPAFANGFGGPDGLRYLRSLDFVDRNNIGLEGHSMGGWAVLSAAAAIPDGYKAIVLEGSGTGAPFAAEGTPTSPRNIAIVFARFDEFAPIMWGVPRALEVTSSEKLRHLFGTQDSVVPGQLYGSIAEGNARILYTPGGTHPWNHQSSAAIGSAVDWFQRTLTGGAPKPAADQVWAWKEVGTATAFVGFVLLLLGVLDLCLRLPYFASLMASPVTVAASRDARWWATLAIGALLPAVTFLPFAEIGTRVLPPSRWFPQAFTNQVVVWALLNALIVGALSLLPGRRGMRFHHVSTTRATLLAFITIAVGYAMVAAMFAFFQVDLRYWFVALKPIGATQIDAFVAYAIPFAMFFLVILRSLHASLGAQANSARTQYAVNVVALAGGFAVFLVVQYGLLFSGGRMLSIFMNDPLRIVIAINFVPLMAIVAVVATFAYRRTGSYLPGALISAAIVAWYVVVGQASQAAT